MSAFDTAVACTRDVIACLNANHFATPPFGPVPDAQAKLRREANNLLDALVIAQEAESRGVRMPDLPVRPEGEPVPDTEAHALHVRAAEQLKDMPPPPEPTPLGQLPPEEHARQEQAKQAEEQRQQEVSQRQASERQAREAQAQAQAGTPAGRRSGPENRILP